MFSTYKNCKVLINDNYYHAQSVSISQQASVDPGYLVGDKYNTNYLASNGLINSFKVSYLLTGKDVLAQSILDEETPIKIEFGGISCLSGYLKDYGFSLSPNQPVVVTSDIVFFTNLTGNFTPTYETVTEAQCLNVADATVYALPGNKIGQIDNILNLSYRYSVSVEPQFYIGETIPSRVVFGPKDINVDISYDTTNGSLPVSGSDANLQINLFHPQDNSIRQSFGCNGILVQKQSSSEESNLLINSINIKQNNLEKLNLFDSISYNNSKPIVYFINKSTGYYGTEITVSGKNLSLVEQVYYFNSVKDNTFQIINDNQIKTHIPDNAISGPISLFSERGSVETSNVLVGGLPITIDSIIYYTGEIGNSIIISGNNFYEISNVIFSSGVNANFSTTNSSIIYATVPKNVTYGPIYIVSSSFGLSGRSSGNFIPKPVIYGFNPTSGFTGQFISLSGDAFNGVTGIKINNLPASVSCEFSILNNSGISLRVPSGNTKGPVKLYTFSGVTSISSNDFYPYAWITGITPLSGRINTPIEISGIGFIPELLYSSGSKYLVGFNGASGYFDMTNNIKLSGVVPSGAKSGVLNVYSQNLEKYPSSFVFAVRNNPPTFNYFNPVSGKRSGIVSIIGNNLADITQIIITGNNTGLIVNSANISQSITNNYVNVIIPFLTGGRYDAIVSTIEGNTTGSGLYVLENPYISGFSPTTGGAGTLINISGLNIYPYISQVWLDGSGFQANIDTGSYTYNNNSLRFYLPSNISSGNHSVVVYNSVTSGSGTTSIKFVPSPIINGFSPITGNWGSGIVVSGDYLDLVNSGSIFNIPINSFTIVGKTGLSFTLPNNTSTDYIKLFNSFGYGQSNNLLIIRPPLPVITGFSPNPTYYTTGTIISGNYLNTVTEIQFSGVTGGLVRLFNFSGVSGTGLFFNIPGGITSGYIRLVNQGGYSQSTQFLTLVPDAQINIVSQRSGAYGNSMYISGNNLSGTVPYFSFLTIANVYADNISYINETGLYFSVPHEITTNTIKILSRNKTFTYDSGLFYVLPTISGISGSLSYPTGGYITVTGINAYNNSGIFISGDNGGFYTISSNTNYTGDVFYITGYTGFRTGYSMITTKVNNNFAGSGKLFLGSSLDFSINNGISGSVTQSQLNNVLFNTRVTISQPAPIINGFFNTGQITGGIITISGSNLFSTNKVLFVSNLITGTGAIYTYNDNTLQVKTASIPSGTGLFFVISPFGVTNSGAFKTVPGLFISGYTPAQGHTGDYIRISGSGLLTVTGVSFGNTNSSYTLTNELGTTILSGIVPTAFSCCGDTVQICVYNEGSSYCL